MKKKDSLAQLNPNIVFNKTKRQKTEIYFILFGLFFSVTNVIMFWLVPNVSSIFMAFQKKVGFETVWTLENFSYIWSEVINPESNIVNAIGNTFLYFFYDLIVLTPLIYIVSFFVYKKIPCANVFRYIFIVPNMLSSVAISSCFKFMFSPGGPIPEVWEMIFGTKPLFFADSRYVNPTLMFYLFWLSFGGGMILYVATFSRIPQEIVEAGRLDGLTYFGEMINIVFPLTWPFFSTMLLLKFCGMLGAGAPVLLFTKGAYGTYSLSYWIFEQTTGGGTYRASAFGLVLTFIQLPISLLFYHFANKVEPIEY